MNRKNSSIEKLISILLENDQNREWVWCKIVLKNENEKKNDLCGNKVVYKIKIDPLWGWFGMKMFWW